MNTEAINRWLQLGGNLAILLGLVFVGIQLYQDRSLKRAELLDQVYQSEFDRQLLILGESPAGAISKAAMQPQELTHEEVYSLMVYFDLILSQRERMRQLEDLGLFGEEWREADLPQSFRTPIGERALAISLPAFEVPEEVKERWAATAATESYETGLRERILAYQSDG